jgi:integrase
MKAAEVLDKVLKGKRIARNTVKNYRAAFASWTKFNEDWPSDAAMINEWMAQIPAHYSDETIETWYHSLKAAGRYMQKVMGREPDGRYRFFNAFEDSERPIVSKKKRRYLTAEQLLDVLKACRGEQEMALVSTFIDSTCRAGDLGYDAREPDRHPGLYGRNVGVNSLHLKGKTGEYTYRLDSRICLELKRLAGGDEQPVFKNRYGKIARTSDLCYYVRTIMFRAGITGKKIGPHTLRHSGASLVARKTGSALIVKALLNQEKMDTAMLYIHDAEASIQQDISPLALINVEPVMPEQLLLGEKATGEPVIVESNEVIVQDLVEDMFDTIPESVKIRPQFDSKDLLLLRSVMVNFARVYRGDTRVFECQGLLKRILRKVNVC